MVKLSKKADYAIVALSHLFATNSPASAKSIAECYNLSPQMLANVLKRLASNGVLQSKRGVAGGYTLARSPNRIFIGEVIDIIDGPVHFSDCSNHAVGCGSEEHCPAKLPMKIIHQRIKGFVDSLSLTDIVNENLYRELSLKTVTEFQGLE